MLDRGDAVVVIDSGTAAGLGYLEGSTAELLRADIRESEALKQALPGCAAIVHLAAHPSVPESIARPLDDAAVNVDGSLALLEAARHAGIQRFVFASSNAVVGGHPPPAYEGLVPLPVSPYGASKAAAEAYLRAYERAYGMTTVSLRFANAYGPWSAHKASVVAQFVRGYLGGGPLRVGGDGRQTRDFIYVDDVAAMVLACLDAPAHRIAGEVFQVGTGVETSVLELAKTLFEVGGAAVTIEFTELRAGDVPRSVSSITKAEDVLGWSPKVQLRDGLAGTLEWFRARSSTAANE